jgi:carbonic anhydrase/acetyltransferase-like protein (isoleucine patch superfamily)
VIVGFRGAQPAIDASAFVAASAVVIGDVVIGAKSSVWFHAVVRGDVFPIRIGARTNLQDHVVVHVVGGRIATTVGDDVTVGHRAILHGCTIGNRVLVGMGAILLDGVEVGDDCLIGAGTLVTPGMKIEAGRLVLGNPGRVVRALNDEERAHLVQSAAGYVGYAAEYRAAGIS